MSQIKVVKGAKPEPSDGQPASTSPPVPTTGPSQPRSPLISLIGQEVVIQQRGGILIDGVIREYKDGFLRLGPAKITGVRSEVSVPWVLVDRGTIAHLHAPGDLSPVAQ